MALFSIPIQLYKGEEQKTPPAPSLEPSLQEPFPDNPLRCAQCGFSITHTDWRLSIGGKQAHTLFNPQGSVFNLHTYSHAPGVIHLGEPSPEFTWFAGTRWQIVICKKCQSHIGWKFSGKDAPFWGLIDNRLKQDPEQGFHH
uniref:CULT domain-containing protein n=1 Tax=Magnetococcus massalia (strain MO-1) TaxID=451514 RepID=A0A1S7LE96_MAGMO|nr:Conserved protein of unknown function. Similar to cereblon isoform 4 (modular protein) in MSR-1 [Candidatus Magnetococcus massalia]